jgi:hypothetical protein
LENKVNLEKLQEIRLCLRRRYASRTKIRKIFKQWDKDNTGEISVYEAYKMINKLSIPINIDETRALISSSNQRKTENLNVEEFMHLIYNDNDELKLRLKHISSKINNKSFPFFYLILIYFYLYLLIEKNQNQIHNYIHNYIHIYIHIYIINIYIHKIK